MMLVAFSQAAHAGFDFQIRTFNGAVETPTFILGDTVTVRVFANDTAAPPAAPDFSTQNMTGFSTKIFASTSDANDGAGAQTFNPLFVSGTGSSGANFDVSGRNYSGSAVAGFTASSPIELVSFSYTASVAGDTTLSFDPNMVQHALTFVAPAPGDGYAPTNLIGRTVSVVPEPSSLAIIGLVAMGLGFRRSRRKLVC